MDPAQTGRDRIGAVHMKRNLRIERQLGNWMRARLPHHPAEFVMFVLKQGWAALFGSDEFSVRLLSALLGIASVWLTYLVARRLYGPLAGLLADAFSLDTGPPAASRPPALGPDEAALLAR